VVLLNRDSHDVDVKPQGAPRFLERERRQLRSLLRGRGLNVDADDRSAPRRLDADGRDVVDADQHVGQSVELSIAEGVAGVRPRELDVYRPEVPTHQDR
jgi:hypothetical protein